MQCHNTALQQSACALHAHAKPIKKMNERYGIGAILYLVVSHGNCPPPLIQMSGSLIVIAKSTYPNIYSTVKKIRSISNEHAIRSKERARVRAIMIRPSSLLCLKYGKALL